MNEITITPEFKMTLTGLEVVGQPSFEQWVNVGRELWHSKQAICWMIGDWINFGEKAYGGKYEQALDETDYTLQTLENYAYTCRAILPTARRELVSFSNHSEVASLSEADREYALDKLENKQWNRDDLRAWKKALKGDTDTEQTVTLRFTHMQRSDDKLIVVFIPPDGEIVDFKAVVKKAKPKAELERAG